MTEPVPVIRKLEYALADGRLPRWIPEGTIWQRVERREWLLTIDGFDPALVERIRSENDVETVEVSTASVAGSRRR